MTLPAWISGSDGAVRVLVRATPRASHERLELASQGVRIHVTAPADAGRANVALIKLLAKRLGVPKSSIRVIRGEKSREKLVEVTGPTRSEVHDALSS